MLEVVGAFVVGLIALAACLVLLEIVRAYIRTAFGLERVMRLRREAGDPVKIPLWALIRCWHRFTWHPRRGFRVGDSVVPLDPRKPVVSYTEWRFG